MEVLNERGVSDFFTMDQPFPEKQELFNFERLQTKTKEFTRLSYTELVLELEHLKIETRLITEMFSNVMGECEN